MQRFIRCFSKAEPKITNHSTAQMFSLELLKWQDKIYWVDETKVVKAEKIEGNIKNE